MSKQSDLVKVSDGDGSALTSLSAPNLTGTVASARMPAGSVLQVLQVVSTTSTDTTSASYIDAAGLSLSITPFSTSSKILVLCDLRVRGQSNDSINLGLQIVRGSTAVYEDDKAFNIGVNANVGVAAHTAFNYLDSPNTTSATTYKLQIRRSSVAGIGYSVSVNGSAGNKSTFTLMEIAG
jgi:hypothetical protein